MASFGDWIQRYLIRPFPILAKDGRIYRLLKSCIYCLFLALFLRSDWYVIPAVIPLILLSYVLGKPSRRQAIKNQSGFRFLSSILSLFFIAVFWALIHAEGFGPFWRYIITLRTDNMEYRVNLLLATLSNLKYILVLAIALLILLSYSKAFRKWLGNRSIRVRMIVEMLLNFLLLALFLFSILFFLPQFPAYNLSPYLHLLL